MFRRSCFFIFCISLFVLPSHAKLQANFEQNKKQYGEPVLLESFPTKKGFTGYATYFLSSNWKVKAFFIDDIVRTEHLLPREGKEPKLNRSEVREWAKKMFSPSHRGSYKKNLKRHRVDGHFFDKGLIAYEYLIEGKATKGYKTVKVLFYENNDRYNKINPKAYL